MLNFIFDKNLLRLKPAYYAIYLFPDLKVGAIDNFSLSANYKKL